MMTATPTIIDGDELLARHEASFLLESGVSLQQIEDLRRTKRCREEQAVCKQLLRNYLYQKEDALPGVQVFICKNNEHKDSEEITTATEITKETTNIVLCYAAALDGVNQPASACTMLESYLMSRSSGEMDVPVTLALAKLYFKANDKAKAMEMCQQILQQLRSVSCVADICSQEDASDAYHLAGWVYIHADDHSSAYRIWNEGGQLLPTCSVLSTQTRKRVCWDSINPSEVDVISESSSLCSFDRQQDFDGISVSPNRHCPVVALFDPVTQQNQLVFVTKRPLLSATECARVLQHVQEFHTQHREGVWSTVRHSSVKTTDVAVEDVATLRPWLRMILKQRLYPMLRTAFPKLADGTSLGECGDRLRVHDAFIVRYDAEEDMSLSLPEHSDTSIISFTVALNQRGRDFEGGGTWFEAIDRDDGEGCAVGADEGHAVAFAGPLRHAGYPVTSGCRIILVLFLYAQDFAYGHLLEEYNKEHRSHEKEHCDETSSRSGSSDHITRIPSMEHANDACALIDGKRPSGDSPGGFVVYNQTVELVSMLNRRVDSILD
jgi:hypothetical protein